MNIVHFVPKAQCHRLRRIFPGETWPEVMDQFAFTDQQLQDLRSAQRWRVSNSEVHLPYPSDDTQ